MSTFSVSENNTDNFLESRLKIDYLLDSKAIEKRDIVDVVKGLQSSPKFLPPRYFYDQKGSELFEEICKLPEYYPTRTEGKILQQYGREIIDRTKAIELVELGSGSSSKTRFLLDAYRDLGNYFYYTPVDVSGSMLQSTAKKLLKDYPTLKIQGKVATYHQALEQITTYYLGKRMIIFLGSSIGNFTPKEYDRFIDELTTALNAEDYFLLGIDLQKSTTVLEAAYNDSQGVTAAFNLNILQHLNHRFGANFNLDLFNHEAIYNSSKQQIEMYLIAQHSQTVQLQDLDLTINITAGEKILTEISRKFNLKQIEQYLKKNSLTLIQTYTDEQKKFGLLLLQKR